MLLRLLLRVMVPLLMHKFKREKLGQEHELLFASVISGIKASWWYDGMCYSKLSLPGSSCMTPFGTPKYFLFAIDHMHSTRMTVLILTAGKKRPN